MPIGALYHFGVNLFDFKNVPDRTAPSTKGAVDPTGPVYRGYTSSKLDKSTGVLYHFSTNLFDFKNNLYMDLKLTTVKHSSMVARIASIIAVETKGAIEPAKAHMAGTLHDIGKLYIDDPKLKYQHPLKGYELLLRENDPEMAEICLTHPFPVSDNFEYIKNYCNGDEGTVEQIYNLLKTIKITPLIRLIQLCDKLAGLDSFVTFEEKIKWYQEKHMANFNFISSETIQININEYSKIKQQMDDLTGTDIYSLLGL